MGARTVLMDFPYILSHMSDAELVDRPKMSAFVNFFGTTGTREDFTLRTIGHSTNKHPKLIRYQTYLNALK